MAKLQSIWSGLPKEVKVALYILVSWALATLVKQLELVNWDSSFLVGIINVLIVLVNNRKEAVTKLVK